MAQYPGGSDGVVDVDLDVSRPSRIVSIPFQNAGTEQLLLARSGRLCGYAIVEPTATAGVDAIIYDGQDAKGSMLIPAFLIAGRRADLWLGEWGAPIERGLFLHMIGGQLDGVIWVRLSV